MEDDDDQTSDKQTHFGLRTSWNDTDLKKAMQAVRKGTSVSGASRHFSIPRRTLRIRLDDEDRRLTTTKPLLLNPHQQEELKKRIQSLLEIGISPNSVVLKQCVSSFYAANSSGKEIADDLMNATVHHWLRSFLNKYNVGSKPKINRLANSRKSLVKNYFDMLAKVMLDQDLFNQPERIYCLEEKCCPLTLQRQIQILNKGIDAATPEMAEKVSVTFSANAIGHAIPPMVFFKGKSVKQDWLDNAPARSEMITCPTSTVTAKMFAYWLDHFVQFKIAGTVLLIYDHNTFPADYRLVQMAKKRDILMLCLPEISNEDLQPMHKGVYQAFEDHWDAEVLQQWSKNPALPIAEHNFGFVFKEAWEKSMTLSGIFAGFRQTGIFPYDRDVLPEIPVDSPDTSSSTSTTDSSSSSSPEIKPSRRSSRVRDNHSTDMFKERFTAAFVKSQQVPKKRKRGLERRPPQKRPAPTLRSRRTTLTSQCPTAESSIVDNVGDSIAPTNPYSAIQSTHALWNTWTAWNSS